MDIGAIFHLLLHFVVPAALAKIFWPKMFIKAWLIMLLTMLVDLDHLLADPIFDPNRCSIGFHPLHQPYIFILYAVLYFFPRTKFVGLGLLIHMALDAIDCL